MTDTQARIVDMDDIDQECSELARAIAPLVLNDLQLEIHDTDTPHGRALVAAVNRAANELENQGVKSMRIAGQLFSALARYELALGQLALAQDGIAEPLYRLQWCTWADGFEAHQQEWKDTDQEFSDEYEANTMREGLDARFRTINIRHRVVEVKP